MSELSPDAKDLLAAARPALGPDPDAIARMRAGVAIAIVGAAPAAAAATSASSAAPTAATGAAATTAAKASVAIATKLVVATLVTGAVATTTVVAVRHHGSSPPAQIEYVAPAPVPAPVPVPAAAPVPAPEPEIVMDPPAPPKPVIVKPHIGLGRENELIQAAGDALDKDDLVTAREQLRIYDQEAAGHGQMIEERGELEVELQCQLGDASAAEVLDRFLKRFPSTSYRRKLISLCNTNQ
jgi:hypothetical protein